jgi:hypothetical protein
LLPLKLVLKQLILRRMPHWEVRSDCSNDHASCHDE